MPNPDLSHFTYTLHIYEGRYHRGMKIIRIGIGVVVVLGILVLSGFIIYRQAFAPTASDLPVGTPPEPESIEVLATELAVPWDITWLPDGSTLITERPGQLLHISTDGTERRLDVPRVSDPGEGGLLGMALHPDYEDNQSLYLYRTYREGELLNEVVRYRYDQDAHELHDEETIIDNIPGARYHDGGRIAFGPDGYLYIATGDASDPDLAQDRDSLAGKILRVDEVGDIPADNPFGTAVYSYGHRNPQGIAWDSNDRLWSTEHGARALDELNRIEAGTNYGWPVIEGDETAPDMETPVAHSGTDETWAPGSLTAVGDTLFFSGLRGQRLYQADIQDDDSVTLQTFFAEEYGRIRTVTTGPDEALYLLTSNTDGRGSAIDEDDRLIRVPLTELID